MRYIILHCLHNNSTNIYKLWCCLHQIKLSHQEVGDHANLYRAAIFLHMAAAGPLPKALSELTEPYTLVVTDARILATVLQMKNSRTTVLNLVPFLLKLSSRKSVDEESL